jgi:putative ABC transport system substrate-binding protein
MAAEHRRLRVSRRRFVQGAGGAGLGLVVGCGRWRGQAQGTTVPDRVSSVWRLGFLGIDDGEAERVRIHTILRGLGELGYVEGQNLVVESRFANVERDYLTALASELVALQPDIIVALSTIAALAAKAATSAIPIVASSGDAVGSGLVPSLARPDGNVTGVSSLSPELSGKRLQLVADIVPELSRVAVLWYADGPAPARAYQEAESAAPRLGAHLISLPVRGPEEFNSAFATAGREQAQALLQLQGPGINANRQRIVDLTSQHRLPAMFSARPFVAAGGLMAYSPDPRAQDQRLAYYVDRILKGAKPADLPVEQPREFDFVINLQTAQALGLTIPPHVLLQATEVIQ